MSSSGDEHPVITGISAITLWVTDMPRSVEFYRELGFNPLYGGAEASFTSFSAGSGYLNLTAEQPAGESRPAWWGRAIFYVSDVDAMYRRALARGLTPDFEPRDAQWGERYFHVADPDGHELSFAKPLG